MTKMHQLNQSDKFVNVSVWNGLVQVHIRNYFKPDNTNQWTPTKKDVALSPAEWATLKDLISVVDTELAFVHDEQKTKSNSFTTAPAGPTQKSLIPSACSYKPPIETMDGGTWRSTNLQSGFDIM